MVALGTDYNILMIARLREEAREGLEPREAAAEAIKHAGPTIAAAGVILAGTFASLMLAGNSFLHLRWASPFRSASPCRRSSWRCSSCPGFTSLIGHAAWWPGHGDEKKADEPEKELVS